ncbi:hypothetical protein [Paenibacillus dendritiformis]|uniref:hypothetical protein n=1 Tax=Paenibacillus dendritiformis TaxID=130049 RepID=UPI00387E14EB
MSEQFQIDMEKVEFLRFRYHNLLTENNKQEEGIVYAGDFQFLMRCLEILIKQNKKKTN